MTKGMPRAIRGYIFSGIYKELGAHLDEISKLRIFWLGAVSAPLGDHTHPARYAQGRLTVHADTSAWASRLRQRQAEIVKLLRHEPFFKHLHELQVRVAPRAPEKNAAGADRPQAAPRSRVPPAAAQLIRAVAERIGDPALRAALLRFGNHADAETSGRAK